ncbi:hypothetical protein [Sphingomonas sp. KR3-1]|uniref:hypothetical protein n=1 Tax=Sphingomonas sp. KR3-1 TaxID=3156611 RepID=UPI0032B396E1
MTSQYDYYQARADAQREIADQLSGAARTQHLTLAAMYDALATRPKPKEAEPPEAQREEGPATPESEGDYLRRRAREERARAADTDDPLVRRIRFEMADEYLRRAEAHA